MENIKNEIKEILISTNREGIDDLIDYMEYIGYFTSPASSGNHCFKEGGLAEHSMNVYKTAEKIWLELETDVPLESIIIASLLHDLGKCGDYNKQMYVENILKSGNKSEAKPYKRNPDLLPVDHATRSLCIANRFIDLTEDEEFAIRFHDGLYERANYDLQGHETPLYIIIHTADLWSSRMIERK